jgi:hypothetical protein
MSTVPIFSLEMSGAIRVTRVTCCVVIRVLNRCWKFSAAAENGGSIWNSYWEYVGMLGFI